MGWTSGFLEIMEITGTSLAKYLIQSIVLLNKLIQCNKMPFVKCSSNITQPLTALKLWEKASQFYLCSLSRYLSIRIQICKSTLLFQNHLDSQLLQNSLL